MPRRESPAGLPPWPIPFDPAYELDWGDAVLGRRLLREHLDATHDSASRRPTTIARHIRWLRAHLGTSRTILDAACGPGLYAVPLAEAGFKVLGVDVSAAAIVHARRLAREHDVAARCRFRTADLRHGDLGTGHDAVLVIYNVVEGFPRAVQVDVLRRLCAALRPGGTLLVEMRTRADHPDGRLSHWEIAASSLLHGRRHLLLTDTAYDATTLTYVLRLTALLPNGTQVTRQTTSQLTPLHRIPALMRRAGLQVETIYDAWTRDVADPGSGSVIVRAIRPR